MEFEDPKDSRGTPLKEGDRVKLIKEVKVGSATLSAGTNLGPIRYWYENNRVEVNRIRVGNDELDIVVKSNLVEKI